MRISGSLKEKSQFFVASALLQLDRIEGLWKLTHAALRGVLITTLDAIEVDRRHQLDLHLANIALD